MIRTIEDLALSIDVHPSCLGMLSEKSKGRIWIAKGVNTDVKAVCDIFALLENPSDTPKRRLDGGASYEILPMIASLEVVVDSGTEIWAVVICEYHDVIDQVEESHRKNVKPMKGLPFVIVCGT